MADYLEAQVLAAKAIRSVDPDVPIFIEASRWDSADGFRELEPIDVPNVIYQVHMYVPGEFTHQGVHNKVTGIAYPGAALILAACRTLHSCHAFPVSSTGC